MKIHLTRYQYHALFQMQYKIRGVKHNQNNLRIFIIADFYAIPFNGFFSPSIFLHVEMRDYIERD